MNSRPTAAVLGAVVLVGSVAGCIGDDGARAWNPANVELGEVDVVSIDASIWDVSLSPAAARYAYTDDDQMCVAPITADIDATCVEASANPALISSVAWSDDADRVVWTDDFIRLFAEPDVRMLDVVTGDASVLTEDDVTAIFPTDEQPPDIDVAPFFDTDGVVHFFRSAEVSDRAELLRIDDEGDVERVGSDRLRSNMLITSAVMAADDERFVALADSTDEPGSALVVIDPSEESVDVIELDEQSLLLDAADGRALVVSSRDLGSLTTSSFTLVSLDDGRDRTLRFDVDDGAFVSAGGFSPDGAFVVATVTNLPRDDEPTVLHLVGLELDDDGRVVDEVVVADADDLELEPDENFLSGIGRAGEIVWTEDGTLVLSTSQSRLLLIETANTG